MECKKYYKILHYSKFPSPIGELHFSIHQRKCRSSSVRRSFRPLSGSYISQQCKNQMLDSTAKMFPSPIGELHFSMILIIYKKGGKNVSVPYRGATFLNWHQTMAHVQCVVTVSVPYRGATFLNVITNFIKSTTAVSVPYRGATFLNREGRVRLLMDTLFPSPIGELHFSIRDN